MQGYNIKYKVWLTISFSPWALAFHFLFPQEKKIKVVSLVFPRCNVFLFTRISTFLKIFSRFLEKIHAPNSLNWNYCSYIFLHVEDKIKSMRPIQLPEPPSPTAHRGTPDIFESGVHTFVRRAVVIGNGFPSSENQSIGLVRALGFSDNYFLYVSI
jgi:hypothetical protein